MSRKKAADAKQHKSDDIVRSNQDLTHAMDAEALMKFENLKSLNLKLLKEEYARRQKMESLIQTMGDLEMELNRTKSEREGLVSESVELGEKLARMDLEKSVMVLFIAVEMSVQTEIIQQRINSLEIERWEVKISNEEKERQIGNLIGKLSNAEIALKNEEEVSKRVSAENDEMSQILDSKIEEVEIMRASILEFDERNREVMREMGELQDAYNSLVSLKAEMEMLIASLTMDKESLKKSLAASHESEHEMKEEIREVIRVKEAFEEMAFAELCKRQKMEDIATELNETVANLQKEEKKLCGVMAELEKRCIGGEVRAMELEMEIDQLIEDRNLFEKRIEHLAADKAAMEKDFSEALEKLTVQEHKIEELVSEKSIMLVANGRLDSEVGMLHNQVAELKSLISALENSLRVDKERIKSLESEASLIQHQVELVTVERNEMETYLTQEKQKARALKEKIEGLEQKVEQGLLAALKAEAESSAISAENEELKSQLEALKKEMNSAQNMIVLAREEVESMKDKVASADSNTELVLKMLKQTTMVCSMYCTEVGNENLVDDERTTNNEKINPFVHEMEMIKTTFRNEECKVETMKKKVESLQRSADKAQKKSFWALISSALIAAVSFAITARGNQ